MTQVTPEQLPIPAAAHSEFVRNWQSEVDPPASWYKTYSSMAYKVEKLGDRIFHLTPVVGKPVYTFDDLNDFIEASREFTMSLFTKRFIKDVDQYRVLHGQPRSHTLRHYPPYWTFV